MKAFIVAIIAFVICIIVCCLLIASGGLKVLLTLPVMMLTFMLVLSVKQAQMYEKDTD